MTEETYTTSSRTKYLIVAAVVLLVFLAAYGFAASRSNAAANAPLIGGPVQPVSQSSAGLPAACSGGDCSSCSESTAPSTAPAASTTVAGNVQRISVDVSKGYFDPTTIQARAGIPLEISFGQGSGCMAEVVFPDFGVKQDLTRGGAVVKLPALTAGTYGFSCGMDMVFGELVVK